MASGDWQNVYWQIGLEEPPEVVSIGKNVHGFDPVDVYRLRDLWSLHAYSYTATLQADGVELPIRDGYVGLTPPGVTTRYAYVGLSSHIYVHLRLPEGGEKRPIRAMQDAGARFPAIHKALSDVIGLAHTEPKRVNARVWDLLWELLETPDTARAADAPHRAVRKASILIERGLSEPLSVKDIAAEVGVSYSYLGRLFQEAYGEPVISFIRRRRMERALHLLQDSTLPIKFIAASVGMPDLQQFNKAVRQHTGSSPRRVREEGTH